MLPFAAAAFAAEPPTAALSTAPPAAVLASRDEPAPEGRAPVSLKLALVPSVGIAAGADVPVDGVALGVLTMSPSVEGLDLQLAASWVDGKATGLQAAFGATVAGEVEGVQLTSGVAWAVGDVKLAQLSAGAAVAGGTVTGLQAAAGVSVADGVVGVQSAPVVVAQRVEGLQAGLLTVGDEVRGVQLGLLNVGRDVDGLQLGLVNVARTSKVSIAPLNFVGDGLHRVDVWASESAVGSAALKFGSKHVYTMLGAGWVNRTQPWWTFGGGFGLHLPAGPAWIELDDSVWSLAAGNVLVPGVHNKLRAQVGVDLVKGHLAPFAGVSVNTWWGLGEVAPRATRGLPEWADPTRSWVAWPGVHAGVSF
jgi:hypothetical protein